MEPHVKAQILGRVNSIDNLDLINYIKQGHIRLDELLSAGLNGAKRQAISEVIEKENISQKAREEEERIQREKEQLKKLHLDKVQRKDPSYSEAIIKQLLADGIITNADLYSIGFTPLDIDKIFNYIEVDTGFDEWANLPPLPNGRTDVYVFGIVGSGKSSMLAGILYQAKMRGILMPDVNHLVGTKYQHDLTNRIRLGILPKSTSIDMLNYISVTLYDSGNQPHPLSIIEMSGEKFSQTYETGSLSNEKSIGARQYLRSQNRKIIMFVIDYEHFSSGFDRNFTTNPKRKLGAQSDQLETVMSMLSNDGTLDKTDAVFIVITKADLLSENADIKVATQRFIEETEYRNFLSICKRLRDAHGFKLVLHPYSLGKFVLPMTYTFTPAYSDNLLADLISFSYSSKPGWLNKLFK